MARLIKAVRSGPGFFFFFLLRFCGLSGPGENMAGLIKAVRSSPSFFFSSFFLLRF